MSRLLIGRLFTREFTSRFPTRNFAYLSRLTQKSPTSANHDHDHHKPELFVSRNYSQHNDPETPLGRLAGLGDKGSKGSLFKGSDRYGPSSSTSSPKSRISLSRSSRNSFSTPPSSSSQMGSTGFSSPQYSATFSSQSQSSSSSSNNQFNSRDPSSYEQALSSNPQLVKLSFAEGFFYGQENRKKPRSRILYLIRETMIIVVIVTIVYYVVSGETPFKRAILGKTRYEIDSDQIDVTFNDVKGCDESKQELADVVEFLKNPEKFARIGCKLPKGLLLVGPPGTGKTLLARAVAGEAGVPFFHASGSEFDEILVGQGARRVRDLFEKAKQRAPCVIFIDEIDSVGGKRTNSVLHPYANQTINQLLAEMDGFAQNEGVLVIGATNRSSDLDKALTRPGRFDLIVTVPKPDFQGRKELLRYYLDKVRTSLDIDLDILCRTTIGFTGAEIENLVNQAGLKTATDGMDHITQETLEFARDKILMGPERRSKLPDREQNLMTAYHESGHALVAYYTEKADKLHKITIIARGGSLGHTSILPMRDHESATKESLQAKIDCLLGGRVAEELIYGGDRVTEGCADDLAKANKLATVMVKDLGMSDRIGMRTIRDEQSEQSPIVLSKFSDATSELVEAEISKLLEESRERARKLLTNHEKELKLLAEALLKYETLDAAEVKMIIEGKDPRIVRHDNKRNRDNNNKLSNLPRGGTNPPDRLPLDLLK